MIIASYYTLPLIMLKLKVYVGFQRREATELESYKYMYVDTNLVPLMSDETKNFAGSLVLDL